MSLLEQLDRVPAWRDHLLGGATPALADAIAAVTTEALLLSVASGDHEACAAIQRRMVGLVRLNVRRVLRDTARCEAVTQETLVDALEDAARFDPRRSSALEWLLVRAHQQATDGLSPTGDTDPRPPDRNRRPIDARHHIGDPTPRHPSGTLHPRCSYLPRAEPWVSP